jgi:choline-sulfatase
VLCICDQLRAFETGCYGNLVIRTPHIDGVAREGVRFEHAISSFPVCMAARSVMMSGQYNRTCTGGVANVSYASRPGDFALPEYPYPGRPHLRAETLPERLSAAGYHTAVVGKWHIHSWPHDIGFDRWLIPRVHHCHTSQLYTENGGPELVAPGFSVDFEAERVERFIEERARRAAEPFFLYFSLSPPHNPLSDAPERYLSMYWPAEIPIRANLDLSLPLPEQDYWYRVYRWDYRYYALGLPYTQEVPADYDLRQLIAHYYGLTTWVDDAFGRMLAALERNGLAEDTIVVFTSDHGDNLGSHNLVQKGGPNEEATRVPLVMRWPGRLPAGRLVSDTAAGLVDIAPTLLALAGVEAPAHFQGKSVADTARGTGAALYPWTIIETGQGAGVRTPSHLYFLPWGPQKPRLGPLPLFYFDIGADPWQGRNLAPCGAAWTATRNAQEARRALATPGLVAPDDGVAPELDRLVRAWDERTAWMA